MATHNLSQHFQSINPSKLPRHGVLVLFGYGIIVRVERGHLVIEDGIGSQRRRFRLPRVGHGLRRLVVIGNDGLISLSALRWISDMGAAFVMLERDGRVITTTGPVRPSDARLRRAQAQAEHSGVALCIARELISRKLAGQEAVVREKLLDSNTAEIIARCRVEVDRAKTMDAIRRLESQGAALYWAVWRNLPIFFPKSDLPQVPQHWQAFDTRKSVLSGSQRLASNPINAILNFLYAVLESEARLAASALGLDPALGVLHSDTPARDSLACDLMEPIRPEIDAWVIDFITRQPLKRSWLHEQPDGTCRLMASFAVSLGETAPAWARAVAPFAEWTARQLWSRRRKGANETLPPTRLTQGHKREAKGASPLPPPQRIAPQQNVCNGCGKEIRTGYIHCSQCAVPLQTERIKAAARSARAAAHSAEARAKQAETVRRQRKAAADWSPLSQPDWLTDEFYNEKLRAALASVSNSAIANRLGISRCAASQIRSGKRRAHPRHWASLAELISTRRPVLNV